jgi:hypothetical protein
MGLRFSSEDAIPFTREVVSAVWNKRPLFIRGGSDIFFFGCPCGKDGNIGRVEFRLNIEIHRKHVLEKVEEIYGVPLGREALLNGSGKIGGLAHHVQELLQAPGTREREKKAEATAAYLRRLQSELGFVGDYPGLGHLRALPPGGSSPDRVGDDEGESDE